jgi:hypothetical protein
VFTTEEYRALVSDVELHGVNPFDYLRDVLVRDGDPP